MRIDAYNIYTDQLRDGREETINESFPSEFMEVQEEGLSFADPITVQGKAYLADDELILNLNIIAHGMIPCSICNEMVDVEIGIEDFYYAEPLSEIKSGVFDLRPIVREAILLETPSFVECNEGNCPRRKEIAKYLKKPQQKEEEGHKPFADLDL